VKVELDRQAVMDLLLEAQVVVDIIDALTGESPSRLTDKLQMRTWIVAEELLGDWAVNIGAAPGAREELDDATREETRARFRELAGSDA
jgi:hypothetical protein